MDSSEEGAMWDVAQLVPVKFLDSYRYCCAAGVCVSDRMRIVQALACKGKEKCR